MNQSNGCDLKVLYLCSCDPYTSSPAALIRNRWFSLVLLEHKGRRIRVEAVDTVVSSYAINHESDLTCLSDSRDDSRQAARPHACTPTLRIQDRMWKKYIKSVQERRQEERFLGKGVETTDIFSHSGQRGDAYLLTDSELESSLCLQEGVESINVGGNTFTSPATYIRGGGEPLRQPPPPGRSPDDSQVHTCRHRKS
ncbi:hypothetical protein J6590_078632 [Homalodisca vitripennis]|nr:hypothetical protein J6590_078632 [Homalodisca vitripennis]